MKKSIIAFVIIVLGLIALGSSIYIVNEDEVAVVSTLGKIVEVVINEQDLDLVKSNLVDNNREHIKIIDTKGLHFKIPFIQSINKYTSKYLTYKSREEIINTKDDKRIEIAMYAQYRIIDPVTFKLAVGQKSEAHNRMDEMIYKVVIQSANALSFDEFFDQFILEDLLAEKQIVLNEELKREYGIYITDIGINRKNFPDFNIESIEKKMTQQIEKESDKLISEGDSEYNQAKAATDRERSEKVAQAIEFAATVKAEADAEAIRIYQNSLEKDLPFYQFIKRMEIYKNMKDTTIFVDSENAIFELLNGY